MAEIRRNELTGEDILFSEIRAKRPMLFNLGGGNYATDTACCPFCEENERLAAPLVYKVGDIRAIENKYPAVLSMDGVHEVIIDTPLHTAKPHEFTAERFSSLFHLFAERYRYLYGKKNVEYIQIFKNQGINAGATQTHSHWQLIALERVPERPKKMREAFTAGYCPICAEQAAAELTIIENEYSYALCPRASRFGYEIAISSKRHVSCLEQMRMPEIEALSEIIRDVLKRLVKRLGDIDYNINLYNHLPHFFIEIIPRLGRVAGFELSSGCWVNSDFPEKTSKILKNVDISSNL